MAVGVDDIQQAHNVWVFQLLEQRDLSDRRRRNAFILGFEADLLEGDDAARVGEVARFVDDAVGPWQARQ